MKQYKLIKEYPGSPPLFGLVTYLEATKIYQVGDDTRYRYSNKEIEQYPEFWQEIVQKDYQVLSVINKINHSFINISQIYDEVVEKEFLSKPNKYNINSIKRLSDNEIFIIGDRVDGRYTRNKKILSFFIRIDKIICAGTQDGFIQLKDLIKKTKQKLFTTEDGVDVFKGDKFWLVNIDFSTYDEIDNIYKFIETSISSYKNITKDFPSKDQKFFSTKEAAEDYIVMNKPCLSIKDIIKESCIEKDFNYLNNLKDLVKSKLNK